MTMRYWVPTVVLTLLVAGGKATARAQTGADSTEIQNFYRAWSEATFRDGPSGYASYFAGEGRLLPPGEAPVVGRAAIAEWRRRVVAEATYTIRIESITVDDLHILPGWATQLSTLRGQRVPQAGGEPVPFENKYFDLLRRSAEGRWEFVYRMWNSNLK